MERDRFRRIVAPVLAVGLLAGCTAPEQPPVGPYQSELILGTSSEEGCSGRYSIKTNEGALRNPIHDAKPLSDKLRLEVNFEPKTTSSIFVVAQILDTNSVRSGWATIIDDVSDRPHTLQTLWDECRFRTADVLWDGKRGNVAPLIP